MGANVGIFAHPKIKMNDATTRLIDAAFEMAAATKKEYPKESTPEFFALTDVAHRLECACIAYKSALASPTPIVAPTQEAGQEGEAEQMIAWIGDPNASEDRLDEIEKFWGEGTRFREAVAQAMMHNGAPIKSASPATPSAAGEWAERALAAAREITGCHRRAQNAEVYATIILKHLPAGHDQGESEDDKLIQERDDAENAADKLASLALGEPIDWSDHSAKWQEAIDKLEAAGHDGREDGELGPFDPKTGVAIAEMINAFLKWKLPESVCSDLCVTRQGKGRIGTNLLSLPEAMQMIQEVVCPVIAHHLPAVGDKERLDFLLDYITSKGLNGMKKIVWSLYDDEGESLNHLKKVSEEDVADLKFDRPAIDRFRAARTQSKEQT